MFRSRLTRSAGIALAITALGASSAAAQPSDLRTPDAVSAGTPSGVQYTPGDVRSPDARSAAPVTKVTPINDLRSPDVRDHAAGRGTFSAPDVTVVKVSDPAPVATGFDWGDATIGAGGLLGLALLAAGGALFITHHRHSNLRIG
jgi:hypothetical protein